MVAYLHTPAVFVSPAERASPGLVNGGVALGGVALGGVALGGVALGEGDSPGVGLGTEGMPSTVVPCGTEPSLEASLTPGLANGQTPTSPDSPFIGYIIAIHRKMVGTAGDDDDTVGIILPGLQVS